MTKRQLDVKRAMHVARRKKEAKKKAAKAMSNVEKHLPEALRKQAQ